MNMKKKIYQHPNVQMVCLKQQHPLLSESSTAGKAQKNSYGQETDWE